MAVAKGIGIPESSKYWITRELDHIASTELTEMEIAARMEELYAIAEQQVKDEIMKTYGNFANKSGLPKDEIFELVEDYDIKAMERKIEDLMKQAAQRKKAGKKLADQDIKDLQKYNLTMRANRLEYLKANIELEQLRARMDIATLQEEEYIKSAMAEYKRQSGILGMTIDGAPSTINQIVNASFLSATWDERLWGNFDSLRQELNKKLTAGITQGLNPRPLAKSLEKAFGVSKYEAERLMITELSRIRAEVFKDSMDQAGFTEYEYLAEPSACDICLYLDGKTFKIKDMEIGVNMYPMHPFCKCATAGHESREDFEAELKRLGLDKLPGEDMAGLTLDDREQYQSNITNRFESALMNDNPEIYANKPTRINNLEAMERLVENLPDDELKVLDWLTGKSAGDDYYSRDRGSYNRGRDHINMNFNTGIGASETNINYPDSFNTYMHEQFHRLDGYFKVTSNNSRLQGVMENDFIGFVNRNLGTFNYDDFEEMMMLIGDPDEKMEVVRSIKKGILGLQVDVPGAYSRKVKRAASSFTDSLGGATHGYVDVIDMGYYGHETDYYSDRGIRLAMSEAWAGYGEHRFIHDDMSKKIYKNVFQGTQKEFETYFKEIVRKIDAGEM